MESQITIRVFGKVQGVWFRKSTKDVADRLGIRGIVMNEPDGSVYIQAKGDDEALKELVTFCKEGPPEAEVGNVNVETEELANFKDFRIIGD